MSLTSICRCFEPREYLSNRRFPYSEWNDVISRSRATGGPCLPRETTILHPTQARLGSTVRKKNNYRLGNPCLLVCLFVRSFRFDSI